MGQSAQNHGGTGGKGYRDHPKGKPDWMLVASVEKCCSRKDSGLGKGIGLEIVSKTELWKRKQAAREEAPPFSRLRHGLPAHHPWIAGSWSVFLLERGGAGG